MHVSLQQSAREPGDKATGSHVHEYHLLVHRLAVCPVYRLGYVIAISRSLLSHTYKTMITGLMPCQKDVHIYIVNTAVCGIAEFT